MGLIVVTAAVVAAAGLFAFGCGGSAPKVDPVTVLSRSAAAMKQIKGFHFVYEVHKPSSAKPGSGLDIARITGNVDAQGHMDAMVDAVFGGVPVTVGFVSMGDTQYIQDPISHKWQSVAAASKGGVNAHHITGKVAPEYVKAIAGSVDTTNLFPTEIWIGVNDSYVYEVDIFGAATPNETDKYWRSITLSDLNKTFDIKAPQ